MIFGGASNTETALRRVEHGRASVGKFAQSWMDVFAYPFKGSGKYILPIGAVGLLLGKWLIAKANIQEVGSVWADPMCLVYLLAGMGPLGFILLYLSDLIGTSAGEGAEPPVWPKIDRWTDAFRGVLVLLGPISVSFLPAIVYHLWQGDANPWFRFALLALGWLYCPMAILGVVLWESAEGLSPLRVVPAIVKALPAYLLSLPAMPLLYLMSMVPARGVSGVAMAVPAMYLLMVMGRTLGVIYRTYAHRLKWF